MFFLFRQLFNLFFFLYTQQLNFLVSELGTFLFFKLQVLLNFGELIFLFHNFCINFNLSNFCLAHIGSLPLCNVSLGPCLFFRFLQICNVLDCLFLDFLYFRQFFVLTMFQECFIDLVFLIDVLELFSDI